MYCGACDPGGDAVGDENKFGVVGHVFLRALLVFLDQTEFFLKKMIALFEFVVFQIDRGQIVRFALAVILADGPFRIEHIIRGIRQGDRFHHLPDHAVGEDVGGSAVFFAHCESIVAAVAHLLYGVGGEDKTAVCAVSAALDDLEIVALFGADVAESGTSAHDVNDHGGQFKRRQIADRFLFEADSEPGTSGHDAFSRRACADDHVDCADFRFRLKESPVEHREKFCGGMGDFTRGRDRITVKSIASGEQCAVDDRFVSFEQQTVQICHFITSIF